MKFSSIPALGGLFAVASASLYTTDVAVVCTGAGPTTVTQTVTVTAAPNSGGSKNWESSSRSPYVKTVGGSVTSVEYSGSQTSVWVYPTGSSSHDCTVAIYEDTTIIDVIIVNINVSIVNDSTTTITSIVTGAHPTWTPPPPLHHTNNTTYTRSWNTTSARSSHTHSMQLSTGVHTHSKNGTHYTNPHSFTLHTKPLSTGASSSSTTSVSYNEPYGTGNLPSSIRITALPAKFTGNGIPPQPTASRSTALPNGRRANAWYA